MSSDTPPVWPSPEASANPVTTPNVAPPARGNRPAVVGALAAVALVGALVGVAADRLAAGALGSAAALPGPLVSSLPHTPPATAPEATPAPPAATGPSANTGPGTGTRPGADQRGSRGTNPGAAPGAGQSAPPSSASAGASADPTQQAVQQVIQKGDDEQTQAVASKDLSVMASSATPDFFQQQQQITQDLIDNGVTAIKLARIEWGPIAINGNTATATAYETWTTNFSDGTTDQSRDRNDYTLVQQDGQWKIQSDEHPDANQVFPGFPGPGNLPPGLGFPSPRQQPTPRTGTTT
jgi:hypothetical protein